MAEFKNPNQQGGQDNRSLLVMMLVMVGVVFGLHYYQAKTNPQTVSPSATPTATQSAPPPQTAAVAPTTSTTTAPAVATGPTVQAAAEATTVVENELYRIEFSNRGAQVRSWVLKRFKDDEGKPLDLVHDTAAMQFGYPLSLYSPYAALTAKLQQALYVPSAKDSVPVPGTLTFTYSDGTLSVTKTFTFDETYVLHADVQVTQNGAPLHTALSWPGGFGDQEDANAYISTQIDTMSGGKTDHVASKKVKGTNGATTNGPFDWAGVSDVYFAAIFLPDQPDSASLTSLYNEIDIAKVHRKGGSGAGTPARGNTMVPILGAALGDASGHIATRIFVGPKVASVLKSVQSTTGRNLEPVVDFGFFGIISRFLFVALQFVHAHIASNWGWAIVVLTLAINVLLLPLRFQTMKSAVKMQRIQPQVNAIKARYKNPKATDPKSAEMNAEVMKLYKDNGVNMFGGCIPNLLQFPLMLAFFYMLRNVVEIRQAHWYWLPDLSHPDPTHILPILMVVSMFIVSFYTPSPGVDPQQQKMMAFTMPLISGYFTWNYASGLALYWATGNLVSIVVQAAMNRSSIGREMRELAAKRARRKGTTIQGKR